MNNTTNMHNIKTFADCKPNEHRPRDNHYGVTFCIKCGRLFNKPCGKPLAPNDAIHIPITPLTFEQWYEQNEDDLHIEFAESGSDREMDFDSERECEDRYIKYLLNIESKL